MTATILDGKQVAERIRKSVGQEVAALAAEGRRLKLAAVLAGESPASLVYARSQAKQCEAIGIDYELVQLPAEGDADCVASQIDRLNGDPSVTGIILLLPLPAGIDAPVMQYQIDPYKDVEGVNPANIGFVFYGQPILAPCTALAVVELIREAEVPLRGTSAVVVGQGAIVGRPVSVMLMLEDATLTSCNEFTADLPRYTRDADLLIVAAGVPKLITPDHVKAGAVVIDVGINRIKTTDESDNPIVKTVGDVDFEAVCQVASAITPVPGGVGPITVTMLLRNIIEADRKQRSRQS